jgi:nucleoside-diphosphate-sugar epimerase
MNIVVLGGTRFIGPEVVRQLLRQGHDVTVFHRGQTNDDRAVSARHVLGNRRNLASYRGEFRALQPDAVLDMLPMNAADAGSVLDTFNGIADGLVAISSIDVYLAYGRLWNTEPGPLVPTPLDEDAPLRETDQPHGQKYDKIGMERTFRESAGMPVTILRLPMVYGRCDPQHRLYSYLKRMDDQRPFILLDEDRAKWRWIRGYVDNVAAAICLALTSEAAAGKTYNVGEQPSPTEAEWIRNIARCAGWSGEIVTMPRRSLPEHLREEYNFKQHMDADTGRIRSELGYREPVSREEALIRTVEWERDHPPAKIDPADYDYDAEDVALEEFRMHRTR